MEQLTAEFQKKWIDSGMMSGATVVVCRKDGIVYREQFGDHKSNAIYSVFSLTKIITSMAALQLQAEGKLHLDDPVRKYLPSFCKPRQANQSSEQPIDFEVPMTIRQCLNHTSGLTYRLGAVVPIEFWAPFERNEWHFSQMVMKGTRAFVDDCLAVCPLLFTPGTRFNYANGHIVVARIVEEVTGLPWDQYVKERITGPLGMVDTTYLVNPQQKARMPQLVIDTNDLDHPVPWPLQGLLRQLTKKVPIMDHVIDKKFIAGDQGLKGTVDDWTRLNRLLLNGGELEGCRLLPPDVVEEMCKSSLPEGAEVCAPFSFQAVSARPKASPTNRAGIIARHVVATEPSVAVEGVGTGSFGITREPGKQFQYRPVNSFPGHSFGLGVAVVEDPIRAGLHPRARGTCWWLGLASTYFAFNPEADIGCLVFTQNLTHTSRQQALADVINAAHTAFL